ncbi:MAG TPA: CatB-related O-acetyltransferase [Blastocatellia bacterium]|nr:CatB-related O-acetyltransferase [Blastocatellia bacterium]
MAQNKRYSAFQIGVGTYGRPNIVYWDAGAKLIIGRYCSIAPGVTILLGGEHRVKWVTTYPFSLLFDEAKDLPGYPYTKGDVIIGNDVWIGQEAMILSGVRIEDGAVIAARSVVTKDVAPYSIVAGNPAQHIRFRFSESEIESLLKIAWWNWPWPKIQEAWPLLQSPDIQSFIDKYSAGDPIEES